jgi:hypothetical protein
VTAIAIAGLVAAGISATSLDAVAHRGERFGAWWDIDMGDYSGPKAFDAGARTVAADKDVQTLAGFSEQGEVATLNGKPIHLAAYTPVKGQAEPVMRAGRPPRKLDEVAVGHDVLRGLHVKIGDTVRVSSVEGGGAVKDRPLTITGEVLFNNPVTTTNSLGEGAVVSSELLGEVAPGVPQRLLARFAPGADRRVVTERLSHTFHGAIRVATPPDEVRNLEGLRSLPWLIAGVIAALAAITLAHALIVTVTRGRRQLAILSVLGMDRWGIRRVTASTTAAIVASAAVIGVPAGLIAGRAVWRWLANTASLAPTAAVGWLAPLLVVVAGLAAAQIVTLLATRRLVHTTPARLLRVD